MGTGSVTDSSLIPRGSSLAETMDSSGVGAMQGVLKSVWMLCCIHTVQFHTLSSLINPIFPMYVCMYLFAFTISYK